MWRYFRNIFQPFCACQTHLANSWKAWPSVQFSWKVAPTLCVTNCPNLNLFCMHFCRASFFSIELFSLSSFFTTSMHLVMCCLCWSIVFCCADSWCRSSSFVRVSSSILLFRTSRSEDAWVSNSCILWHVNSVWNGKRENRIISWTFTGISWWLLMQNIQLVVHV